MSYLGDFPYTQEVHFIGFSYVLRELAQFPSFCPLCPRRSPCSLFYSLLSPAPFGSTFAYRFPSSLLLLFLIFELYWSLLWVPIWGVLFISLFLKTLPTLALASIGAALFIAGDKECLMLDSLLLSQNLKSCFFNFSFIASILRQDLQDSWSFRHWSDANLYALELLVEGARQ